MALDLPGYIVEAINHFTGRTWLLLPLLQWFEQSDERMFLIRGEPGTGKSMILAWLAGTGPVPAEPEAQSQLARLRTRVGAAHFCITASGSTDPKTLAQNMAAQLADNVKDFSKALLATRSDVINIYVEQHLGQVGSDTHVTGVDIKNLNLGDWTGEATFNRLVRDPLKAMYAAGYTAPMLLLVDALDEALSYTGVLSIVELLTRLADLPIPIRILATTRPDPRVLKWFRNVRSLGLITDAPADVDDVRSYTYARLSALDEGRRSRLAERISQVAKGFFLYAALVLQDLLPQLPDIPDLEALHLPAGLSQLYLNSLNRVVGADESRWYELYQPLLGVIAVAQGDGLGQTQIKKITRRNVEQALRTWKQYLDGELPEGPFRFFHKSFVDFLLVDEDNTDYHIDASPMHRQIADHYWGPQTSAGAWHAWDGYGLRYTPTHLAEAAQGSNQPERHELAERLVQLVVDPGFQKMHQDEVRDVTALQRDLEQALRSTAADDDPHALPLTVRTALALVDFRRAQLLPASLSDLARQGEVEAAARRLPLFNVDLEWQQIALLTLAWLGFNKNPKQTCQLRDRVANNLPADGLLRLLVQRLNVTMEGMPVPALDLPSAPPAIVAQALIDRMGGLDPDARLLGGYGVELLAQSDGIIGESKYLSEQDAPLLVAYAATHLDEEGDRYLKQYLTFHTNYSYVLYRTNSLRFVLDAVLRHPNQEWVQAMVPMVVESALAGSRVDFQAGLPLTILAWQAQTPGALSELEVLRDRILNAAAALQPSRGRSDSWGTYNRLLGTMAQAFFVLLHRPADAELLLDRALHLPYGFAGFQSPACLALAEALRICRPGNEASIRQALDRAQQAAHNIQDPTFCARSTARFNAMDRHWWRSPLPAFDVAKTIAHLCQDPSAPDFAAQHLVGEAYRYRDAPHQSGTGPGTGKIPLGSLGHAHTLEALAEAYRRPLSEFQRLNPDRLPGQLLPVGTAVNVPDPGFTTLLATRCAAEALIAPGLSALERVALIQSLVPVAAANPTALDTVLARLVLAIAVARPHDTSLRDALAQAAPQTWLEGLPEEPDASLRLPV